MNAIAEAPATVAADYFGDTTHVSRSMLEDFIRSPALYHGRYIAKTIPLRDETEPMQFGSAVHSLILGGPSVIAAPKCDRRTKIGKDTWAAFIEENADSIILDEETYAAAVNAANAVERHDLARTYTAGIFKRELAVAKQHSTGLLVKSKLDFVSDVGGTTYIGDLKTAGKPWPEIWPKTLPNYGYHRQAAFYLQFDPTAKWVWIVVGSEPPHEVFVYEPDQTTLDIGRQEIDAALVRLADCLESGRWEHPQSGFVNAARLPRWYVERGFEDASGNFTCDW